MRKMAILTAIVVAMSLVSVPFAPANAVTDEQKLLTLINNYRQTKGLSMLTMNNAVSAVAAKHSKNMHDKNELNHVLDGKNPSQRLDDAGIGFTAMVENVAFNKGYPDPIQTCFDGWVNSPGHNANMLNSTITNGGIGICHSDAKGWWFTFMGIKPSGNQTEPDPGNDDDEEEDEGSDDEAENINLTLKQGTSSGYTITFSNTGSTVLVMTTSLGNGSKWITVSPTNVSIQPGAKTIFTLKISAFTDMAPGNYTDTVIFSYSGGKSLYRVNLTVTENTSIPKPDFTLTCPDSLNLPFEAGSYNYVTVVIKNTGNCDINPSVTIVSDPYGMVRLYPDATFLAGKISKGASFTAKMLLLVSKSYDGQTASVTFTFTFGSIKKICKITLIKGNASQFYFTGPQQIKMDFVGKTKTVSYYVTNTGKTKATYTINLYIGSVQCLGVSYITEGKNPTVEPGKSTLIKVTFKLACTPQFSEISGYLHCTRTDSVTKEKASKIHDFKLVK